MGYADHSSSLQWQVRNPMAIGIDPTVDFAFKKLLGSPDHPAITLHFLNAVLGGDPVISSVEFINPFMEKEFDEDKLAILDVKATDNHGRKLNIEMQTTLPGELRSRLAYYAAAQFVEQMKEGDDYKQLRPSIGICVLNGKMFPKVADLHLDFRLRSRKPALKLTDSLQIHLLELPKYTPPSDNGVITDPIEKWVFFFQQAVSLTRQQLIERLGDDAFAEAAGVLEMIARSPKERELYEARLKMQRDERSRLDAARDQALAEGVAKGALAGRIQLLQELLSEPQSELTELIAEPEQKLAAMVTELQERLRSRN